MTERKRRIRDLARRALAVHGLDHDGIALSEAHAAGMAHGVDAYNEATGSALTGPPDCSWCLRPRVDGHHGCCCGD